MSKRETFLEAVCKENVENFLGFIQLHVSKQLLTMLKLNIYMSKVYLKTSCNTVKCIFKFQTNESVGVSAISQVKYTP